MTNKYSFSVLFQDGTSYTENHPTPEEAAYWSREYQRYCSKAIVKITVITGTGEEVVLYEKSAT